MGFCNCSPIEAVRFTRSIALGPYDLPGPSSWAISYKLNASNFIACLRQIDRHCNWGTLSYGGIYWIVKKRMSYRGIYVLLWKVCRRHL